MAIQNLLLPTFKAVSLIFAIAAIVTGAQAVFSPIAFSHSFGIPIGPSPGPKPSPGPSYTTTKNHDNNKSTNKDKSQPASASAFPSNPASTYISLMGIRQLTTGLTLLLFISQQKWTEVATILSLLGVFVAGTDGVFLARQGMWWEAGFHAGPGAGIAGLAGAVLFMGVEG